MCPICTPYLAAPISRFFSTRVEGKINFCWGDIERKFVTGVLPGSGWKMNVNLLLRDETIRNRIWKTFKEQQATRFSFSESSLGIFINCAAWDFTWVLNSKSYYPPG